MSLAQRAAARKPTQVDPLHVFKERAKAVAKLVNGHFLADKQSAVDGLWRFAEGYGLIAELGVDAVQQILAEAFRK